MGTWDRAARRIFMRIVPVLVVAWPMSVAAQKSIDKPMTKTDGDRWFAGAYEVSCEAVASRGNQMLQIFSIGKNEQDALREARRNAVRALVFRGVQTSACDVPALLRPEDFSVEADKYFDTFFREGGPYLSYVAFAGDEVESQVRVGKQVKIGTTVVVQRERLRRDLESAGILSSMAGIFDARRPPR